jgi:hypothetical protein
MGVMMKLKQWLVGICIVFSIGQFPLLAVQDNPIPNNQPACTQVFKRPAVYVAGVCAILASYPIIGMVRAVTQPIAVKNSIIFLDILIKTARQKNISLLRTHIRQMHNLLTVLSSEQKAVLHECIDRKDIDAFIMCAQKYQAELQEVILPLQSFSKDSFSRSVKRIRLAWLDELTALSQWFTSKIQTKKSVISDTQEA